MIKRIAILSLLFLSSFAMPALAAEPSAGKIEGQIINGTEGGSSVADLELTLSTLRDGNEAGTTTARTNAEGRFLFSGLATGAEYTYQITLTFQEAQYATEILSFNEGETTKSVELTVYDSTTSDAAVSIVSAHTVIYVGQGSLKIEEFFLVANMSDRAYIGSGDITATGKRKTLSFPLPTLVSDLEYGGELMTCCILESEGGFIDTMPVLPGSKQIVYSYQVNYSSSTFTFTRSVYHPTLKYNLLVQGESVNVDNDQLTKEGVMNLGGALFSNLSGANLAPGDVLVARLSGLPSASRQPPLLWVGVALVVLSGGFGVTYLLRRRRLQPVPVDNRLSQRQERLLAEIAQLDDDFESGKIGEDSYRRLRAEKKAQLLPLMQRAKGVKARR